MEQRDSQAPLSGTPSIEAPDTAAAPSGGRRNRNVILTVLALGGSAVFMVGLLMARAVPSGSVAASPSSPASAGTVPAPAAAAVSQTPVKGPWTMDNRSLWVGGRRKGVAFELPSENNVAIWMRSVQPALVIRCMGGRVESFVYTQSAATIEADTADHTVTYSFDGGAPVTERWPDSSQHDALFAPDGSAFALRVAMAKTMRFEFTPHNAGRAAATFTVAGLVPLIEPSLKECGWKK